MSKRKSQRNAALTNNNTPTESIPNNVESSNTKRERKNPNAKG